MTTAPSSIGDRLMGMTTCARSVSGDLAVERSGLSTVGGGAIPSLSVIVHQFSSQTAVFEFLLGFGGFGVMPGLGLVMALAKLLLDLLGDNIDGCVKILFTVFGK